MKRHLFLTGAMGIGKSTALAAAIGNRLPRFHGFLTRRTLGPDGHAVSFSLVSPDGAREETFLDFSAGKPEVHLSVFETLGVSSLAGSPLLLDEIGGIELTCPAFASALDAALESGGPILGVLKGPGPASALTKALGLADAYTQSAEALRLRLRQDPDTLLYECGKFDEQALRLAEQWVKEYGP